LESGRAHADLRPANLSRLTTDFASVFRSAAERCGLDFVVDCPPLPHPVAVDAGMWEKVVFNLLSNAVKFTFSGGITVRLRADGDWAELSVSDTGVGIPEDELPRLFERFHRVRDARGRTHEGSGIGLALVTELVTLHGGSVTVTSTSGAGSTFVVRLPLDPSVTVTDLDGGQFSGPGLTGLGLVDEIGRWIDRPPEGVPATGPLYLAPTGSGAGARSPAHVVVADDNADMRSYLARLLGANWRVSVAPDGEQALEIVRRQRPDLVLADVMMPGLDGIGLVQAIRADPALAATPVILVSARAGADASVDALDAGADDYVVKPFAAIELIGRVRAAISTARERQHHLRVVRAHAGRMATVARMTARFAAARTVEDVATVLVAELPVAVHASLAAVGLPGADPVTGPEVEPSLLEAFHRLGRKACAEGRPVLASPDLTEGTDPAARRAVADALRAAGCSAAVLVPLPGQEAGTGWLAAAWLAVDGAPPAVVDTEALTTLEAMAQVAGQTVDRARRDEREREIARTLQRGVLPVGPPAWPGVEVAWRFTSATDGSTVGGDWYDALELGAGRVGLVTGDVAGHGIGAVAAMTRFSAALRAYLAEGLPPAAALHQLNRLALGDPLAPHVTVVCAVLDVVTLDLVWSLAGHPPPVLLRDGTAEALGAPLGPPAGVTDDPGYREATVRLRPGDRLVLYTDGLIERRREGLQLQRLVDVAATAPATAGPEALLDLLGTAFLAEPCEDDVAVVAVRISVPAAAPDQPDRPGQPDPLARPPHPGV
jgi:serine phosphatase RsbU (regulator of sigma subunit)/DNA-binding response OmpR family regulator